MPRPRRSVSAMVAWLAFALSLVALVWNFVVTYVRWPRIDVLLHPVSVLHVQRDGEDYVTESLGVIVINNGAEAASIANVGVRAENGYTIDLQTHQDRGEE